MKIHVVCSGSPYEGQTPTDIGFNRTTLIKKHAGDRFILREDLCGNGRLCFDYDLHQQRITVDSFDLDVKQVLKVIARTKSGREAIHAMVHG